MTAADRINAEPVLTDPFPHLHVTDLFPTQYYDGHLTNGWPALSEFDDRGAMKTLFFKPPAGGGWLEIGNRELWWIFRRHVERVIVPAVAGKLGFDPDGVEIFEDCLITRTHGHVLRPHIDNLNTVIQLLIYLPPDDDHQHLGTQLFRQISEGRPQTLTEQACPGVAQYAHDIGIETELAKTIPFTRNTLFASVVTPTAWHGQELLEDYERRGYQCFIRKRA